MLRADNGSVVWAVPIRAAASVAPSHAMLSAAALPRMGWPSLPYTALEVSCSLSFGRHDPPPPHTAHLYQLRVIPYSDHDDVEVDRAFPLTTCPILPLQGVPFLYELRALLDWTCTATTFTW